jgi:hypothetical protein
MASVAVVCDRCLRVSMCRVVAKAGGASVLASRLYVSLVKNFLMATTEAFLRNEPKLKNS